MTYPGTEAPPPVQPAVQAPAPAEKSGAKKVLPIVGSVLAAAVVGAGALTGWFGIGNPGVGDCVEFTGETDWAVVDCGADEAAAKIVGVQDEKQSEDEFMADETSCSEFATAEGALWLEGSMLTEGSVYCVASL